MVAWTQYCCTPRFLEISILLSILVIQQHYGHSFQTCSTTRSYKRGGEWQSNRWKERTRTHQVIASTVVVGNSPNNQQESKHPPITNDDTTTTKPLSESLLTQAETHIRGNNPSAAFSTLRELYSVDPTAAGLDRLFERCLTLQISVLANDLTTRLMEQQQQQHQQQQQQPVPPPPLPNDGESSTAAVSALVVQLAQERMGLAALLIDKERYEDASIQLQEIASYPRTHPTIVTNNEGGGDALTSSTTRLFAKASAMLYRSIDG